jgi:cytochrome c553
MCAGCHSIGGYKTAFPSVYSVPRIDGQPGHGRSRRVLRSRAGEVGFALKAEDTIRMMKLALSTAAALLALAGVAQAGNPEAGKEKSRTCAACHGADGNSATADFPRLAGQHYDYLVKTLKDYKTGARKNAIMAPQVANLNQRDFEDLAAYYSHQPGLVTRKVPYLVPKSH